MVRDAYGIDATVVPPPPALTPGGELAPIRGVEPGFLLSVARLLPYKNVDLIVDAAAALGRPLVVVGDGPERARLEAKAGPGVTFTGVADDATLAWCYANAGALVAMSYEDYGLTPLEAASFGTPTIALRAGGYLDTVVEGVTGAFVDEPDLQALVDVLGDDSASSVDRAVVVAHAATFSAERFAATLHRAVDDLLA
jgi:glycosyltransferase involved in cell wall biosynthesis